jgi:NAD(P)-dependent dehydrogenase (short-subunit alcohol dehydrogenase family)
VTSLAGKRVAVTGAGSGIGRAGAVRLAEFGAKVCVTDLDLDTAKETVALIEQRGGEAFAARVDVTVPEDNLEMVRQLTGRYGGIDGAFLNAGIYEPHALLGEDLDTWNRHLAVNLTGVLLGIRAAATPMLSTGGSIVVTASTAGLRGGGMMPAYFASKHGVLGLVKAAAADFARYDIRVNAVCPAVIESPPIATAASSADARAMLGAMHPLRRIGQPEEVAEVVAFLLSDAASFMTAAAVPIDGGQTQVMAEGVAFPT